MSFSDPPPPAATSSGLVEWPISTHIGLDMQTMEPWFIRHSPVLTRLLDVYGDELDVVLGWTTECIAQLFVMTSTWGLNYWELELDIAYQSGLTDEERAERIIGKMRSYRQGTPFVIRLVANSFNLGHVTPVEDFPGRRVIIRFDDIRGVPSNIPALQATLERLIRASAILVFEFSYLTWGEVKQSGVKWCQLKESGTTWEQLRTMGPQNLPTGYVCAVV